MLNKIRFGVALVVVALVLSAFLGGEQLSLLLSKKLLFFQFAPSLVQFLLTGGGIASLGFVLILLLTLVLGRVYCACLCPLGILQDAIIFVRKKLRRKQTFHYQPARPVLRYGILTGTALSALLGTFVVLNALDPYSLFGRISVHLLMPVFVFLKNQVVAVLEFFDIYALSVIALPPVPLLVLLSSLMIFLILVVMAVFRGRMYCNTICPVGTLLGIFSRFSLYRIALQQEQCTACGLCERVCRAGCIDSANKTLDATRCVACFDCLNRCPKSAIAYTTVLQKSPSISVDPSRRRFLIGSASAAGAVLVPGGALRAIAKPYFSRTIPGEETGIPIVPPGALSLEHFSTTCTACHLCVNACPVHILQPAWFEYGLQGLWQPTMVYAKGYCAYECHTCGQVCPTGAITALPLHDKQLTQIGKVKLIKDECIVHVDKKECGACAEVCPTHAVYTIEEDNILFPEIKPEHCIGCGGCEHVCPQNPKAIVVEGLAVHAVAEPPFYIQAPEEEAPAQEETEEEFPF